MRKLRTLGFVAALLSTLIIGCGAAEEAAPVGPPAPPPAPKSEPIDVTFRVSNTIDSMARIIGTIGSTNYLVDSMIPQKGMVHIKRDTALPGGLYFLVMPGNVVFQFLLDQDQTFKLTADAKNPFGTAKIEGSFDNELLYQNLLWEQGFQARFQPIEQFYRDMKLDDPARPQYAQQLDLLVKERKDHLQTYKKLHPETFFTKYKLAGQNPEMRDIRLPDSSFDEERRIFHYRNDYWNNTPLDDPRLLRTPIIFNKLNTYMTQITPQVHDSVVKYADLLIEKSRVNKDMFKFIVNWIAIEYHTPKNMGMESAFVYLVDKYFTDKEAFWATPDELTEIRREVNEMRPSLIGKTGQDLLCTNLQGQKESLYDLKGKATILFIYNYECEHCQEEAPDMRKIYDQYHARGLEIYALCTGTDEKEWRAFIPKYKIAPFHNVFDPQYTSNFYQKYHIDITPECYVMDANHKIVCKDLKPNQLPVELDKLLK